MLSTRRRSSAQSSRTGSSPARSTTASAVPWRSAASRTSAGTDAQRRSPRVPSPVASPGVVASVDMGPSSVTTSSGCAGPSASPATVPGARAARSGPGRSSPNRSRRRRWRWVNRNPTRAATSGRATASRGVTSRRSVTREPEPSATTSRSCRHRACIQLRESSRNDPPSRPESATSSNRNECRSDGTSPNASSQLVKLTWGPVNRSRSVGWVMRTNGASSRLTPAIDEAWAHTGPGGAARRLVRSTTIGAVMSPPDPISGAPGAARDSAQLPSPSAPAARRAAMRSPS